MGDWLRKYWTQIVACIAFVVALTTTNIQVTRNKEDIAVLNAKQTSAEEVLSDIRVELSAINTKLELLLEGKVVVKNGNTRQEY